jgi:hypothetical protein
MYPQVRGSRQAHASFTRAGSGTADAAGHRGQDRGLPTGKRADGAGGAGHRAAGQAPRAAVGATLTLDAAGPADHEGAAGAGLALQAGTVARGQHAAGVFFAVDGTGWAAGAAAALQLRTFPAAARGGAGRANEAAAIVDAIRWSFPASVTWRYPRLDGMVVEPQGSGAACQRHQRCSQHDQGARNRHGR